MTHNAEDTVRSHSPLTCPPDDSTQLYLPHLRESRSPLLLLQPSQSGTFCSRVENFRWWRNPHAELVVVQEFRCSVGQQVRTFLGWGGIQVWTYYILGGFSGSTVGGKKQGTQTHAVWQTVLWISHILSEHLVTVLWCLNTFLGHPPASDYRRIVKTAGRTYCIGTLNTDRHFWKVQYPDLKGIAGKQIFFTIVIFDIITLLCYSQKIKRWPVP